MAIHAKLLEFQKKNITPAKVGNNPHYNSAYVPLNEVLEKVKKPLNDMGIIIIQKPDHLVVAININGTISDKQFGLTTQLIDTEDESKVECFVPYVATTDMQKLGGAITYARRYGLMALLALEDSDDDGEIASAKPKSRAKTPIDAEGEPFKGDGSDFKEKVFSI